jgi:heme-degrading monooxygenase HmoA
VRAISTVFTGGEIMRPLCCTLLVLDLGMLGWTLQTEGGEKGDKKVDTRIFELRTYYVNPGKMDALNARFKNHTNKLLEKHGMQLIGFWIDAKEPDRKLIYIVAHKSKEAAGESWKAFGADPEWKAAKAKSEENGKLVEKVDIVFMHPTAYSAIK